jgi:hypothetical protein
VARRTLIALAALLLSGKVNAQAPEAPPWLDSYEVVRECPDVDAFRSAVQQRVSRPLALAFAGWRLAVDIQRDSGGDELLRGQLSSTDAGGAVSTRTLQAGSCAQLVPAQERLLGFPRPAGDIDGDGQADLFFALETGPSTHYLRYGGALPPTHSIH